MAAAAGIVGRTEREVALALEQEMRVRGAEGPSFSSIVAAAENGALPHATPRDVADPGRHARHARHRRAASTATARTARARGRRARSPTTSSRSTRPCCEAQEASLAAVRPGPEGREIDAIARDIIGAAGHAEHFGHGLGHGVGMDIHEAPRLARTADAPLEAGNVVTVEPGIYVPGRGGARIEDLVVVTEDGHDVLSGTPKTLTVVG